MQTQPYQSDKQQMPKPAKKEQPQGQQSQKQGTSSGGLMGTIQEALPVDLSLIKISIGEATFPAKKTDLVAAAEAKGSSTDVLDALRELPERLYESVEEVTSEIEGKMDK